MNNSYCKLNSVCMLFAASCSLYAAFAFFFCFFLMPFVIILCCSLIRQTQRHLNECSDGVYKDNKHFSRETRTNESTYVYRGVQCSLRTETWAAKKMNTSIINKQREQTDKVQLLAVSVALQWVMMSFGLIGHTTTEISQSLCVSVTPLAR